LENTENGTKILQKMQAYADQEGTVFKKLDDDVFMKRQDNLKHALQKPSEYESFQAIYKKEGFDAAIRKTGIFTLHGRIRAKGILLLKKTGLYSILKK
jgi:ASC-1-like (ASCH) protein